MSNDDYEVGYGKPPKHTRFKESQSGNPKGRPKGRRNFSTDVKDTLKEPVRLTKGGKRKTVSTQLATLLRLREQALSGDARALDRMIELARTYNDEDIAQAAAELSSTDAAILEDYNKRLLRQSGMSQPDDNDGTRHGAAQNVDRAKGNENPTEEDDNDAWLR